MKLTTESKVFLGIAAVTVIIIAGAVYLFSRPAPAAPTYTRGQLIPAAAHTKGNASASAYLVEFSDFQCPACRAFEPTVEALTEKYKDKLLFAYRYFPLDQHPFAMDSAISAEAAGRQGKFWEMAKLLFQNQDKFSPTLWAELAKQMGLDVATFEKDRADSSIKDKILKDKAEADRLRLSGTPSFFLNGQLLNVATLEELQTAVTQAVSK